MSKGAAVTHNPLHAGTDDRPQDGGASPAAAGRQSFPLFVQGVELAGRVCAALAILLLVAATIVICDMIVERWMLSRSTVWQSDFVVFSTVASIFLGSPFVLKHKGHIGVDLLPTALHGRRRMVLDIIAHSLSLLFCGLIAWSSYHHFHEALAGGWTTETVAAIPLWIPLLPMPVGFGLLCLQYVAEIIKAIDAGRAGENRS